MYEVDLFHFGLVDCAKPDKGYCSSAPSKENETMLRKGYFILAFLRFWMPRKLRSASAALGLAAIAQGDTANPLWTARQY